MLVPGINTLYRFNSLIDVIVIIQQRIRLLTTVIHALFSHYTLFSNINSDKNLSP